MICERCKIAGNLNEQLNSLEQKEEPGPKTQARIENLRKAVVYNHDACSAKDCMCQHRVGALIARGYEEEQVSSPAGS